MSYGVRLENPRIKIETYSMIISIKYSVVSFKEYLTQCP